MVLFSRFVADLRKIPYASLKELVMAENLRGGNAAPKPIPDPNIILEGAARSSRSRPVTALSSVRGGYHTTEA